MEIFAGLRSQIKNLKDRLKALDTSKKTQKEVKEVVDALNALEERYAKEKAKREEKKKLKEEKANEKVEEVAKESVESPKEEVKVESDAKVEDGTVTMPKKEFVEEHEKLVKELEPMVEEHKEQGKELKEVKEATFNVDDKVEPIRGGEGSWGHVMRPSGINGDPLVYVKWMEGPLKDKHGEYGGYYSHDLKKKAEEPKKDIPPHNPGPEHICPDCKDWHTKHTDLKSNYMTMLQDLKDEHKEAYDKADFAWVARLEQKIKDLESKIQEMYGNEKQASGSVVLKQYGEPKRTFDSYNEALMWLHRQVDYSWDYAQKHQGWTIEENKTADVMDHPSGTERLVTIDQTPPGDKANYNQDGGTSSSEYQDQLAMPSGSDRNLNSAKGVPNSLFDAKTAPHVAEQLNSFINAPYVNAQVSTLGGEEHASILLTVSVDPKKQWVNGILQNSRYGLFHISNDGEIEHYSGSFNLVNEPRMNFRKRNVKNVEQLVAVINDHLAKVNAAHAEPKVSSLQTEAKNKCVICNLEFNSWPEYDAHKKEKHSPKTSALKVNVFNRDWNVEPVKKDSSIGYDISDSEGKKVMHIKPANGKEWSTAELQAALKNELTRGFKQGKLVDNIAFLNEGTKVIVLATSKDKKQVKIANLEHGIRGWVPSTKIKLLALDGQSVAHEGHQDKVLAIHETESLIECPVNGVHWEKKESKLLTHDKPTTQLPATPESLNLEEAKKCKHPETLNRETKDGILYQECMDCGEELPAEYKKESAKVCPKCQSSDIKPTSTWIPGMPVKSMECRQCGYSFTKAPTSDVELKTASFERKCACGHKWDEHRRIESKVPCMECDCSSFKAEKEAAEDFSDDIICSGCGTRWSPTEALKKGKCEICGKPFKEKTALKTALPPTIPNQRGYLDNPPPVDKQARGCDQCNSAMINGVFCHEIGCPNARKEREQEDFENMEMEGSLNKTATVVHRSDGWHVLSEKGKNLGGPYKTKGEAVKRLRQVEYFKHHGSLKPFSKKAAEVLTDPYQALQTQVQTLRDRMSLVQERLQSNPMPKEAGEDEQDNSEMDIPALLEDLSMGIDLLETKLQGDKVEEDVHPAIEEMENLLWSVEEKLGITPKLSEEEKAEPEHTEIVKELDKESSKKTIDISDMDQEKVQKLIKEYERKGYLTYTSSGQLTIEKKAAPIPTDSPTSPVMPTPLPQDIRPTDDDNLEIPTQAPTSKLPQGQKWVWDAANGKFVAMTDPMVSPGKII